MKLKSSSKQFIDHCCHSKNLSPHTIRAYKADLNEFISFAEITYLSECNRDTIKEYLSYLFNEKKLKETSIKRRIACLKSYYHWLCIEFELSSTPFSNLDLKIKTPKRLPKNLSRTELRQLLSVPINQLGFRNRLLISTDEFISSVSNRYHFFQLSTLVVLELLFATGIRVAELSTILLHDINLLDATIPIKGKGNRERQVFITDFALSELIKAYLSVRLAYEPNHTYFLINSRGKPASTQYIRSLVRKAGNRTNIDRTITPHMLRHSTATHLLEAGVDIRYVQRLLGHSSISVTEIYTYVNNTKLKNLVSEKHPLRQIAI